MARTYLRECCFGGKTFCCCLPVRFGLICMTFLGFLFGGILSIVCWFEVAHANPEMMEKQTKIALVAGGLVETVLLLASIIGFIGAIVRKQSFVQTYAYILYGHFLINLGIAIYLLVMVGKATQNAATKACQQTVKDTGAQDQCVGLIKFIREIIIGISVVVLIVELYGAIIAARYVNQIQREKRRKRDVRESRIRDAEEYEIQKIRHSKHMSEMSLAKSTTDFDRDYDPYDQAEAHHSHSRPASSHDYQSVPLVSEYDHGYGGGSLGHRPDLEDLETPRHHRQDVSEHGDYRSVGSHHDPARTPLGVQLVDGPLRGPSPNESHDTHDTLPSYRS